MLKDMDSGIPQWVPSRSRKFRVNANHLPISYTQRTWISGQPRSLWFRYGSAGSRVICGYFWKTLKTWFSIPIFLYGGRAIKNKQRFGQGPRLPTSGNIEISSVRQYIALSTSLLFFWLDIRESKNAFGE